MTEEKLQKLLFSFKCERDTDIEYFLHSKAVSYEQLSKARTYLIVAEEDLAAKSIDEVVILGYIALALKVLTVHESVSNRTRKELDGLSAKIHGEQITSFPVYLIGQLGRNSKAQKADLPGDTLLNYAFDIIQASVDAVGGRYVLIECHDNTSLIGFYARNHFVTLPNEPDQDRTMVQMIRKIV